MKATSQRPSSAIDSVVGCWASATLGQTREARTQGKTRQIKAIPSPAGECAKGVETGSGRRFGQCGCKHFCRYWFREVGIEPGGDTGLACLGRHVSGERNH